MEMEELEPKPRSRPRRVSFTNLVVFVLDRSGSMASKDTYDGRMKWEHLVETVEYLLERFEKSKMKESFRVAFVWFNDTVDIVEYNGKRIFRVDTGEAKQVFEQVKSRYPPTGMTAIGDAISAATKIVEEYINLRGPEEPPEKYVSIFLFTDGRETVRDNKYVEQKADELRKKLQMTSIHGEGGIVSAGFATIAMGFDADEKLLREIAMDMKENQKKALSDAGVLKYVDPPNNVKLFMPFPKDKGFTKDWVEAIRRFCERTSETLIETG